MTQVTDSYGAPPGAAVRAQGFAGKMRYLSATAGKSITPAELDEALTDGCPVGFVYEDTTTDVNGGAPAGQAHGTIARQLLDGLHLPADGSVVVYVACDENLPNSAYPTSLECVQAFADTARVTPGGYGPRPWLAYLRTHGVRFLWETGSSSFNTGPDVAPQLQQLVETVVVSGVSCDVNNVGAPDWGQWPRPAGSAGPQESEDGVFDLFIVNVTDGSGGEYLWDRKAGKVIHIDVGETVADLEAAGVKAIRVSSAFLQQLQAGQG